MNKLLISALLLIVSQGALSEQTVRWAKTNKLSHAGATVTDTAAPMVSACAIRIDDIVAGETDVVDGDLTVTNDTAGNVGFTAEIYECDPDCRNLRSGDDYSGIEGGNVTPAMHHATFQPRAMTSWDAAEGSTSLVLMLRSYSGAVAGGHVTINRCGLFVTRYRP